MTQINSSQLTTLLSSLPGFYTPAGGNTISIGLETKAAPSKTTSNKDAFASISTSAKSLNSLYGDIKKTGNNAAISGFKKSVISMASGLDNSGLDNFVKMGEAAFTAKDSSFFSGMMSTYNILTENRKGTLAGSFLSEAGKTFSDFGLNSTKNFSTTASHILKIEENTGNNKTITGADALGEFVSEWRAIRSKDISEEEKEAQTKTLSNDILSKTNTRDVVEIIRS